MPTLTIRPVQKPVPLSNQSLFRSSYTFTRFLSLGGDTTSAILYQISADLLRPGFSGNRVSCALCYHELWEY